MKKLFQMLRPAAAPAPSANPPTASTPAAPAKGFLELGLDPAICRAVADEGYEAPTPIQAQAIPHVLAGRDLLGCAQTGTGKTAAFALPIIHNLGKQQPQGRGIRCLVLTPTRELALQIAESFETYGRHSKLHTTVIFGGVGENPQKQALQRGPDVVIATPGRLLDLMGQGFVDLKKLSIFVLDEADRMLDMGFIHDVKRVIQALPAQRQNLLFSATMPKDIQDLAMRVLKNPAKVEVTPVATTAEKIDQFIYFVDRANKRRLLTHLLEKENVTRGLVFTRTKAIANRVSEYLNKAGFTAEAIHGNKSQSARQRALDNFKKGSTRILVASDLAARGIDVELISHVINFDLPNVPETYVHRIGRTGRAEASGIAFSFCDQEEKAFLRDIERTIRMKIAVAEHPFPLGTPSDKDEVPLDRPGFRGERRQMQGRGGGGGGGRPQQRPQNQQQRPPQQQRPQGQQPSGGAGGGGGRRRRRGRGGSGGGGSGGGGSAGAQGAGN